LTFFYLGVTKKIGKRKYLEIQFNPTMVVNTRARSSSIFSGIRSISIGIFPSRSLAQS
jgi:hypothetical protein